MLHNYVELQLLQQLVYGCCTSFTVIPSTKIKNEFQRLSLITKSIGIERVNLFCFINFFLAIVTKIDEYFLKSFTKFTKGR